MYDRRYTPDGISELKENEIFVFGSNLEGSHAVELQGLPIIALVLYGD